MILRFPGGSIKPPIRWFVAPLWLVWTINSANAEPPKPDESTTKLLKTFRDEFIKVTPGKGKFPASFEMANGNAVRKIELSQPFEMNKYEVPQNLYKVVTGADPSRWRGPRNSVEMVDWNAAVAFCEKATTALRDLKLIGADELVRLPTEIEWEYVCRAGAKTAYSFGDDPAKLGDYGWFHGNAAGNDPPVGAKKANPWGFHDMHGYLWEWCSDKIPGKAAGREERVIRGGAWTSDAKQCRSDSRMLVDPKKSGPDIGFRCVLAKAAR